MNNLSLSLIIEGVLSRHLDGAYRNIAAELENALEAALAQQETDVTKIAGWCALCEEPNGCPHGHSEEEWIEANHRMIEKRRAALAQQAQPEPYFAGSPCGVQFKFEPDKQLITRVGVCRHEATETRTI